MNSATSVAEKRTSTSSKQDGCQVLFEAAFERTTKEIEFNPKWSNGTGLFDFAVYGEHAPTIPYGSIVKSSSPHGRKMILVGTRLGNVIVFERFNGHPKNSTPVYSYQSTANFTQGGWFVDMVLDDYEMELAVGTDVQPHIGKRLETIYSAMRRKPRKT